MKPFWDETVLGKVSSTHAHNCVAQPLENWTFTVATCSRSQKIGFVNVVKNDLRSEVVNVEDEREAMHIAHRCQ